MDGSKPPLSRHDLGGRNGFDAEPIAGGALPEARSDSSMVVYCGDAEQVSQGFILALRAMGLEVNPLDESVALSAISPIKEDDHDA